MVPENFQTNLRSLKRTRENNNYEYIEFGKLVKEVLHLTEALLLRTNQLIVFPILRNHGDVYLPSSTEPRN